MEYCTVQCTVYNVHGRASLLPSTVDIICTLLYSKGLLQLDPCYQLNYDYKLNNVLAGLFCTVKENMHRVEI